MPRLHVTKITSVGAVTAGDNPEADILFYKSKPVEPLEGRTEGSDNLSLDLSHLTDEDRDTVQKHIDGLEAEIGELKDAAASEDEDENLLPDDLPEPVAKALADQAEAIAKADARAVKAEADAADLRDERETEKYTAMAGAYRNVLGPVDEVAPVLKDIAKGAPKASEKLHGFLSTLVKMDGFDALLREYGDNAADGSAVDKHTAYAKELRDNDPDLSAAEARAEAWRRNPGLKEQAREEEGAVK